MQKLLYSFWFFKKRANENQIIHKRSKGIFPIKILKLFFLMYFE